MSILDLRDTEEVVLEKKGDYWTDGLLGKTQIPGVYLITNQRVAFRAKGLLGKAKENSVELELSDIESISKCNVGKGVMKVIPTGVKVKTTDGTSYVFSILKRDQFLSALSQIPMEEV